MSGEDRDESIENIFAVLIEKGENIPKEEFSKNFKGKMDRSKIN